MVKTVLRTRAQTTCVYFRQNCERIDNLLGALCFFFSSSSAIVLLLLLSMFFMFGGLLLKYMWEKFFKLYTVLIMQWFSVNATDNGKCCIDFPLTCSLIFHCCIEHTPRSKKEIFWTILKYFPKYNWVDVVLGWMKQKRLFQIQIRTPLWVKVLFKFVFYNKGGLLSKINLANATDKCRKGQFHCSDEIL